MIREFYNDIKKIIINNSIFRKKIVLGSAVIHRVTSEIFIVTQIDGNGLSIYRPGYCNYVPTNLINNRYSFASLPLVGNNLTDFDYERLTPALDLYYSKMLDDIFIDVKRKFFNFQYSKNNILNNAAAIGWLVREKENYQLHLITSVHASGFYYSLYNNINYLRVNAYDFHDMFLQADKPYRFPAIVRKLNNYCMNEDESAYYEAALTHYHLR